MYDVDMKGKGWNSQLKYGNGPYYGEQAVACSLHSSSSWRHPTLGSLHRSSDVDGHETVSAMPGSHLLLPMESLLLPLHLQARTLSAM